MTGVKSLLWRLVHRLPWWVTRRICDLCDEFPFDPRDDAEWGRGEPVTLTVNASLRSSHRPSPSAVGAWSCPHMSITASGFASAPQAPCGCAMQPLTATR